MAGALKDIQRRERFWEEMFSIIQKNRNFKMSVTSPFHISRD